MLASLKIRRGMLWDLHYINARLHADHMTSDFACWIQPSYVALVFYQILYTAAG